jgi:hypothetical protein
MEQVCVINEQQYPSHNIKLNNDDYDIVVVAVVVVVVVMVVVVFNAQAAGAIPFTFWHPSIIPK